MAIIKPLNGSDKLRDMYPKVNENFSSLNSELGDLTQTVDNNKVDQDNRASQIETDSVNRDNRIEQESKDRDNRIEQESKDRDEANRSEVHSRITQVEQDSITRHNEHTNSTTAHKAENISYAGSIPNKQNLKDAVEEAYIRTSHIVSTQVSGKDNEVIDLRRGADGVNRTAAGDLIREIHTQQIDSAKQTATLKQGLQVLNVAQAGPFNVLNFKGRTLMNLGAKMDLESAKNYLFYSLNGKCGIKVGAEANYTYGFKTITGQTSAVYSLRDDFKGKVNGSVVEVPHKVSALKPSTLATPISQADNMGPTSVSGISTLDGTTVLFTTSVNGEISQHLFSFDLIAIVERKFGIGFFAGCSTVAQKVQRLKDRLTKITANWHGFGSGPNGNRATINRWRFSANEWQQVTSGSHQNATVTKLTSLLSSSISDWIGNDGFVHIIAFADASNGTVASTINTDYIDIELEYAAANMPFLTSTRLYEITAPEKTKMDGMTAAQRDAYIAETYPFVQDVKHVWAPVVEKRGKNLLPPFTSGEWTLHANAKALEPYRLQLDATAGYQNSFIAIPVIDGQTYRISATHNGELYVHKGVGVGGAVVGAISGGLTFTVDSSYSGFVTLRATNPNTGTFTFTNPQLELGTVATPFEPQNNDYLYFPNVQLAASLEGSVADQLIGRDGGFVKVKRWETDVLLDVALAFSSGNDFEGYKFVRIPLSSFNGIRSNSLFSNGHSLVKYNGTTLKEQTVNNGRDSFNTANDGANNLNITVSDVETGFGETYIPTADEWKAYFNGWQAKTVDANGKPTSWRNIVDGVDAPTAHRATHRTN
ncbi:hypothetical protein [Ammoniphilus sp. YIM 78166]|uniref:hypothetical protein n=1 Tax=Ammoniphilus sp. YIM 78166 TaxID=1644106 RepID=UPI00106F6087|nr:hypothetical protein [Ammoniphilus sp. YIM 78166]